MIIKIGKIRVPVLAVVTAVPRAVRRAQAVAGDDRSPDSPGGTTVTPGEVLECVLTFTTALAEEITEPFLRANGLAA